MASDSPIPVDLISGFQGAGKTTLIQSLSECLWQDEFVLFLQNERGKAALSPETGKRMVEEWQGGCICCSASALFEQTLRHMISQHHPDRVVIELAGTARLSDVKSLFSGLRELLALEHLIYVLSAVEFSRRWEQSQRFLEQQLRECPALLLTQTDCAGSAEEEILSLMRETAPRCMVFKGYDHLDALYNRSRVYSSLSFKKVHRTSIRAK